MNEMKTPKPIKYPQDVDLSPRVVELMQRLDRLPAGTFAVTITKPDIPGGQWQIEIVRTEPIMRFALSKY